MSNTTGSALAVAGDQKFWDAHQLAALKQLGIDQASNGDLAVFLNFAQRTGLDPFARQIYMIGRNSNQGKKWTIQASIDGLRIVAERSGDYAGQVGPEYCGEDGQWRDTWTSNTPPVAARVGVLRHGFQAPLYGVAYYEEYAQKNSPMWSDKPRLMLAKCAEALALRKAFPNDLAGLYTADEMGAAERQATTPAAETIQADPQTGEIIEDAQVEIVDEGNPNPASDAQLKAIGAMMRKLGVTEADDRHALAGKIVGRAIADGHELTKADAHKVIDTIKPLADSDNPVAAYAEWSW